MPRPRDELLALAKDNPRVNIRDALLDWETQRLG